MPEQTHGKGNIVNVHTARAHGISYADATMAVYGSYYIGAEAKDPTLGPLSGRNTDIDGRAKNTYNMVEPMKDYFSKPGSPWVVMDDSRRWMERHGQDTLKEQQQRMGNGYFVTLYHKESGKIMIASPGLEGDDDIGQRAGVPKMATHWLKRSMGDIGDIAFNVREGAIEGSTHLRQTRAISDYIGELSGEIRAGHISVQLNGKTQQLHMGANEDPRSRFVIAGHSAGTIPGQALSGIGYKAINFEPRMYDKGFEDRLMKNIGYISGHVPDRASFRANEEAGIVNIRSSVPNIWNNGNIVPESEFKRESPGKDVVYGVPGAKTSDNFTINGQHRAEVFASGLLNIRGSTEFEGAMRLVENALPGQSARDQISAAPAVHNAPAVTASFTPAQP